MRYNRLIRTILAAALVLSFAGVALAQTGQTPPAGKSAEDFFREGMVKARDGDYKSAVEDFTRAIELYPGTYGSGDRGAANAYLYRAAARYQLGTGAGPFRITRSSVALNRAHFVFRARAQSPTPIRPKSLCGRRSCWRARVTRAGLKRISSRRRSSITPRAT